MRHRFFAVVLVTAQAFGCGASNVAPPAPATAPETGTVYPFEAKSIDGENVRLDKYRGKVLLVVNVASKCGFTPQYDGLEALYKQHASEGLVLLGFPCDQFGNQEPGNEAQIKSFCRMNYGVTFPLFSKVEVNGPNALPLYTFMRAEQKGSFGKDQPGAEKLYAHLEKTHPELLDTDAVKWNFTKFLVDRKGKVVKRFESSETPQSIEAEVVARLRER